MGQVNRPFFGPGGGTGAVVVGSGAVGSVEVSTVAGVVAVGTGAGSMTVTGDVPTNAGPFALASVP